MKMIVGTPMNAVAGTSSAACSRSPNRWTTTCSACSSSTCGEKIHGDLDELNHHFGLDYWSNRIDSWEVSTTSSAATRCEVAGRRVFITHNFDFEWRGYPLACSRPLQASTAVDITGVDIYHPTEDEAQRDRLRRRHRPGVETEAQGQHGWVPFPGQLRLRASGAVEYWHRTPSTIPLKHIGRGLLSHDLEPNPTYREAGMLARSPNRKWGSGSST